MSLIILLIFLLPLALAATLIVRGLRGFRIGDHPVCRRCGFDLFGTPSSARCGECGADLTQDRAVAVGHHHRRYGFLIAGICLLVVSVALGGSQLVSIDLRYVPKAYLIWKSASPEKETRSAALAELTRRNATGALAESDWDHIGAKAVEYRSDPARSWDDAWGDLMKKGREDHRLSDAMWEKYLVCLAHQAFFGPASRRNDAEQELYHRTLDDLVNAHAVQAVAEEVLAYQAQPDSPWQEHWGDWLEDAKASNQLSADQWKRYLTNALQGAFSLRLRARVRQGDMLPFSLDYAALRGGSRTSAGPMMYVSKIQMHWEGLPAQKITSESALPFDWQLNQPFELLRHVFAYAFPASIQPGDHQMHLTASIAVWTDKNALKSPSACTVQIDLPAAFTLLPSDQPTVKMIDSPKWQTSIQRDLKVLLWYDKERPSSVECSMHILHPPLGLGFDAYLRIKGQTKKIGSFACPAGPDPVWLFIGTADYTQNDGPVDVVLYSSKSPAIESIDTYEVWEGGMIFKGVKVTPR